MPARIKPKIFISSSFKDVTDQAEVALALRQRIIEDAASLAVDCWAYETRPLAPTTDSDKIIDECFAGIQACDLFVFLQTGRHGSGVGYVEDLLSSYLELELFAAAMLKKPILVLHLRDREPPPALRHVLALLRQAFDGAAYQVGDERELREHFRSVCLELGEQRALPNFDVYRRLPDWLATPRTQATIAHDIAAPALLFLEGRFAADGKAADVGKAQALLDQVVSGIRGAGEAQRAMSHGAAMFRLWAAIRELMDDRATARTDPLLAPLWDRAFGLWASHASWFGLHGHLWMGPMAAVNAQSRLRADFASNKSFRAANDVREPLGARASALYSIAQRIQSREKQVFYFKEVEQLATRAMAHDRNEAQGTRTIRGLAGMRLVQLRHYWKAWDAERDLRAALKIRERTGAPRPQIGESMVNLGFLFALSFRRRRGFQLMSEGIEHMRTAEGPDGKSFLMNGLRKVEMAAKRHNDNKRIEEARSEIERLTEVTEAFDQTRAVE